MEKFRWIKNITNESSNKNACFAWCQKWAAHIIRFELHLSSFIWNIKKKDYEYKNVTLSLPANLQHIDIYYTNTRQNMIPSLPKDLVP